MANDTSKDAKETLDTFVELKEVVDSIKTSLEKTAESLKSLNDIAKKTSKTLPDEQIKNLKDAVDELNPSVDSLSKALNAIGSDVADKLGEGADKTKNLSQNLDGTSDSMKNLVSDSSMRELKRELFGAISGTRNLHSVWRVLSKFVGTKWGVAIAASIGMISGLRQGLMNTAAILKSLGGLFASVTKGMFRFGVSILSIPFKLLGTLIDIAKSGPMGTEYIQAIEDLRKEFGDLKNDVNKTVFDISKSFKGFNQTGLSTWMVFGNMAERLNFLRENFKAMGFAFDAITKELHKSAGVLLAYQKALGMTGEDMKGVTQFAVAMGRSLEDVQNEITKHTLAFSGGVIDKRFSRQVVKAVQDVKHFGGATVKEIAIAAQYAKKLNVELESIVGTLDAFETFDSAADSAARLSQAFGLQVDAFKLVQAQDPAEQIDMLRKSFFAAGKSADTFSRQQLNLLAQTTGLDAATAKLVFSRNNEGKSLDEIKKKAAATEKKQMTQAESMQKIAGAIERLVKQMSFFKGGYFAHFFQGMKKGIERSQAFRDLMFQIRRGLLEAYMSGIKFGSVFINKFPGVLKIMLSLTKVLNAERIRKLFDGISAEVIKFSEEIEKGNGPASFRRLMDGLRKQFFDFFDLQEGPGKDLLNGIRTFLKAISKVFAGGVNWIMKEVTKTMKALTYIVTYPDGMIEAVKQGATKSGGVVYQLIFPIIEAIKEAWPEFRDAFVELIKVSYEKLKMELSKPPASGWIASALLAMFAVSFGPIVTRTLTAMMGAALTGVFLEGFKKVGKSEVAEEGVKTALTGVFGKGGSASKIIGSPLMKVVGSIFAALFVAAIGIGVSEGIKKYKSKISDSFDDAEKTIASGATGLIDMLTLGIIPDALLDQVPEYFAKLTKTVRLALNKILGGLGEDIIGYLDSYMTMFQGIGDILVGIFEGDTSRVGDGIVNLLEGAFGIAWGAIKIWFVKLPMLVVKYASKALTTIYSAVANLIASGLEKLGLKQFAEMIRGFSKNIKTFGNWIGNVFDDLGNAFSKIGKVVSKALSIFGNLFSNDSSVGGAMEWIDTNLVKFLKKSFEIIGNIFDGLSGNDDSPTGKILYFGRIFFQLVTPIGWAVSSIWVSFKLFVAAYEWLTNGFEKENSNLSKIMKIMYTIWSSALKAIKLVFVGIYAVGEWFFDQYKWFMKEMWSLFSDMSFTDAIAKMWSDISKDFAEGAKWIDENLKKIGIDLDFSIDRLYKALGGKEKTKLSSEEVENIKMNATDMGKHAVRAAKEGFDAVKEDEPVSLNNILDMDFGNIGEMSGGQIGGIKSTIEDVKEVTNLIDSFDPTQLSALADKMSQVFAEGGGMYNFVKQLSESIDTEGIKKASNVMGNYRDLIVSAAEGMKAGGIAVALKAVEDMVNAANKLDNLLNEGNIGKINVLAKLQNVAGAIGLGGKMRYTIQNKDVQINLDLTVTMKADEVEKVIVQRRKSVIRNRLNNADYDQNKVKGPVTNIPGNTSDVVSPIGAAGWDT